MTWLIHAGALRYRHFTILFHRIISWGFSVYVFIFTFYGLVLHLVIVMRAALSNQKYVPTLYASLIEMFVSSSTLRLCVCIS